MGLDAGIDLRVNQLPCVTLEDYFSIVELVDLRHAVGPYPYRTELIQASAGKAISERMTLLLALVAFGGYELFPAHPDHGKPHRQSEGDRDL